eukprot:Rhum_TRINITY_DN14517_c9_g1::Rhum_TRINITY_DN14517_c9_g1_i1::g.95299::m.95299
MKRHPTAPSSSAAMPHPLRRLHVSFLLLASLLLAPLSLLPTAGAVVLCRNDRLDPPGVCAARYAPIEASVRSELSGQLHVLPLLVRLAWHSAGTYGAGLSPPGGTSGGCLRHLPESAHAQNRGLQPAVRVVMLLVASHPTVSFADMTQLAAAVGHELLGSGEMYFTPGRPDYSESVARSLCTPAGRVPRSDKAPGDVFPYPLTAERFLESFSRLFGGTEERVAQRAVALMGAHSLGGVTTAVSGVSAPFDATPLTFDNGYYKKMLTVDWSAAEVVEPSAFPKAPVFLDNGAGGSNTAALVSDVSLLAHPLTRAAVERFAANRTAFFEVYAAAWESISEAGVDRESGGCGGGGGGGSGGATPKAGSALQIRSRPDLVYDHVRPIAVDGPALELYSAFRKRRKSSGGRADSTETTVYVAVVSAAPEGWLGVAFPVDAGVMAPAPYAVTHGEGGVQHWAITEASLEGLVELAPGKRWEAVSDVAHEFVNGRQILSMVWRAVDNDSVLPGFDPARAFVNVARDPANAALQSHRQASAITVNLTSGQQQVTHRSRRLSWRLLHGYLMAAASFFVIPAGVLAKRYGKRVLGLSDASRRHVGLAFALHVALQTLGVLLVVAGYVVADSKLSSKASAAHKKLAVPCLTVLCLSWAFGLVARVECLEALLRRSLQYGRAAKVLHAVLGGTALLLLVVQCVLGVRSLRALYPGGDEAWGVSTFTYAGAAAAATAAGGGSSACSAGAQQGETSSSSRNSSISSSQASGGTSRTARHTMPAMTNAIDTDSTSALRTVTVLPNRSPAAEPTVMRTLFDVGTTTIAGEHSRLWLSESTWPTPEDKERKRSTAKGVLSARGHSGSLARLSASFSMRFDMAERSPLRAGADTGCSTVHTPSKARRARIRRHDGGAPVLPAPDESSEAGLRRREGRSPTSSLGTSARLRERSFWRARRAHVSISDAEHSHTVKKIRLSGRERTLPRFANATSDRESFSTPVSTMVTPTHTSAAPASPLGPSVSPLRRCAMPTPNRMWRPPIGIRSCRGAKARPTTAHTDVTTVVSSHPATHSGRRQSGGGTSSGRILAKERRIRFSPRPAPREPTTAAPAPMGHLSIVG